MKRMERAWINTKADKRRVYYNICIIKYFIDIISPGNDILSKLRDLFTRFPEVDVAALGFPADWEQEPLRKV